MGFSLVVSTFRNSFGLDIYYGVLEFFKVGSDLREDGSIRFELFVLDKVMGSGDRRSLFSSVFLLFR